MVYYVQTLPTIRHGEQTVKAFQEQRKNPDKHHLPAKNSQADSTEDRKSEAAKQVVIEEKVNIFAEQSIRIER